MNYSPFYRPSLLLQFHLAGEDKSTVKRTPEQSKEDRTERMTSIINLLSITLFVDIKGGGAKAVNLRAMPPTCVHSCQCCPDIPHGRVVDGDRWRKVEAGRRCDESQEKAASKSDR